MSPSLPGAARASSRRRGPQRHPAPRRAPPPRKPQYGLRRQKLRRARTSGAATSSLARSSTRQALGRAYAGCGDVASGLAALRSGDTRASSRSPSCFSSATIALVKPCDPLLELVVRHLVVRVHLAERRLVHRRCARSSWPPPSPGRACAAERPRVFEGSARRSGAMVSRSHPASSVISPRLRKLAPITSVLWPKFLK